MACEVRKKPELRTLESEITESLESGIHGHGVRNPTVGIRNPRCGIRNPRLPWIPLHGANQGMEVSCLLCWNKEKLYSLAKLPDR